MEQREILQTGKTREAGFSDRNFVSILYLENRITNQSKVSKFANNDIKTSEAGTYENKIQKTKNDQSSATLGVKVQTRKRMNDWLSKKERRVDALALRAEERRDKLRKAAVSCT